MTHVSAQIFKEQIQDPFGSILASVAWEVCISYIITIKAPPAQLVFGCDMMFHITSIEK